MLFVGFTLQVSLFAWQTRNAADNMFNVQYYYKYYNTRNWFEVEKMCNEIFSNTARFVCSASSM